MALLELTGRNDRDITKLLDEADKVRFKTDKPTTGDEFIPQRLYDYMEKAKVILDRTLETFRLLVFNSRTRFFK